MMPFSAVSATRRALGPGLAVLLLVSVASAHPPGGLDDARPGPPPAPGDRLMDAPPDIPPPGMALPFPGSAPLPLRGLDLSEAQQDRVFEILHLQAPALRLKFKAVRAAREELARLSAATPFDAGAARAASVRLGQASGELALLRAQGEAQIRAVLTPAQRERLQRRPGRPGDDEAPHPPGGSRLPARD